MKVHNFFPLSILQDHIKLADDEKLGLINDIKIMKSNSHNSNYQKSDASWHGILRQSIIRVPQILNLAIDKWGRRIESLMARWSDSHRLNT